MEIEKLHNYLGNQLVFLDRTMQVIDDLFINKESVAVLNNIAPDFFGFFQNIVIDSLMLQVSRLVDPESQGQDKDNATFDRLLNEIKRNNDDAFHEEIYTMYKNLKNIAEQVKDQRNKYIAHLDYQLAFQPRKVGGVVIISMKKYLEIATEIFDKVAQYYFSYSISKKIAYPKGGTKDLLLALKRAFELKQEDEFKYVMGFKRS